MKMTKEDVRLNFLRVLGDSDKPKSFVKIMKGLACKLRLSVYDLSATLKYSGKRKFYTKVKHARSFLLKKNFIQKVEPTADVAGGYALTESGKSFLTALR
jgi:hypothetical protein